METVIDGTYRLREQVGTGGMATVYRADVDLARFDYTTLYAYTQIQSSVAHVDRRQQAEDLAAELREKALDPETIRGILEAKGIPMPAATVALKISNGEGGIERFEGEWKNLLCLNHPNVVKVYGGGTYSDRPYYAMELLCHRISTAKIKTSFTLPQKLDILIQAGRGLQYLHDNGLIHRDIKPENLVTCEEAPGRYVTHVMDLGLAKHIDCDQGLTVTRAVMGSPHYMSPEQMSQSKHVDQQADIYSLGASLYELITGVKPFHNKTTMMEIMMAVGTGETPIPPREHATQLPDPVAGIINCAMARDVEARYASVSQMIEDIREFLECGTGTSQVGYHFERLAAAAANRRDTGNAVKERDRRGPDEQIVPTTPDTTSATVSPAMAAGFVLTLVLAGVLTFMLWPVPPPEPPVAPPAPTARTLQRQSVADPYADLHAALKQANPAYANEGVFEEKDGKVFRVKLIECGVTDLTPLRGLPLTELYVTENGIQDLSPLRGMQLTHLGIALNKIADLAPLRGMPLQVLICNGNPIKDLSPLTDAPLRALLFSPEHVETGLDLLRAKPTLERIGPRWNEDMPAAQFWQALDALKNEVSATTEEL